MAKKFVVRLRKGGVYGNIVANSQVITINPLSDGAIFPSNFTDGRLAGRITTANRSANFLKEIIARPSTTTTSTTRAPNQTTSTTTRAPGTPDSIPNSNLCGAINFNIWQGIVTNDARTPVASQIQGTSGLKEISLAAVRPLFVAFNFNDPTLGNGEYEVDFSRFRVSQNSNGQVEFWYSSTVTLNNRDTNYFGDAAWAGPTANPTRPGPFRYKLELYLKEKLNRPRTKICELIKELSVVERASLATFSITRINPQKVSPGGTIEVTIEYNGIPSGQNVLTLGIIQGQGTGVITDGKMRPDEASIQSPRFIRTTTTNQIETEVILGGSSGRQVVKITFFKNLTWLTGDFNSWNFYLTAPFEIGEERRIFVWGNRDQAKLPILSKGTSSITLDIVRNIPSVPQSYVYPGDTVFINLTGLSGSGNSVILKHWYEYSDGYSIDANHAVGKTRKFRRDWFNVTYVVPPAEGWIIGGSISGDNYPAKTRADKVIQESLVTSYYYPFYPAVNNNVYSKSISLPINNLLPVNYVNTPETNGFIAAQAGTESGVAHFNRAQEYRFDCVVADYYGKSEVDANYIKQSIILRDTRVQFQISLDATSATRLNGSNNIIFAVNANRYFTTNDLGSNGLRFVVSFFGNSITSNSFRLYLDSVEITTTNSSLPGNQSFYYDITSVSSPLLRTLKIELNPNGVAQTGNFGIKMYAYRAQDNPWPSSAEYAKVLDYSSYFYIDKGSSESITISNISCIPSNGILNETPDTNTLTINFDITATSVKTVYWRAEGVNISAEDFDGGNGGNFQTKVGTAEVRGYILKALPDSAEEGDENFVINFYTTDPNSPGSQPFSSLNRQFTIRDTSKSYDEKPKVADAEVPPFYNNVPVAFVITGGAKNTKFDIIALENIYKTDTLGNDGSWSGTCDFTGTPAGPLEIFFVFMATTNQRKLTINFVGNRSSGGSGGGCPDPDMLINISPDSHVRAGSLQVGDIIWTMHEQTLEYGYFSVASKEEINQPKLKITFDNDRDVVVSLSHRFLTDDNQYVMARDLRKGSWVQAKDRRCQVIELTKANVGPVIKLEIERAHTYIVNGFISHNVKDNNPNTGVT